MRQDKAMHTKEEFSTEIRDPDGVTASSSADEKVKGKHGAEVKASGSEDNIYGSL
jgi:hypothetical protein